MSSKLTPETALSRLTSKFPTFNFSKFEYRGGHESSIVICPAHGETVEKYSRIMLDKIKVPCSQCAKEIGTAAIRKDPKKIVEELQAKFPTYDFSKFEYINIDTKSKVICPEHGTYLVSAYYALNRLKTPCRSCSNRILSDTIRMNEDDALRSMVDKFPGYDFSKFEYKGNSVESIVTCPTHGEVLRSRKDMLRTNSACPKCSGNYSKNTEEWIKSIKLLYPDTESLINFEKTVYINAFTNVVMTCIKHGDFEKSPITTINSTGKYVCTKCNIEDRIESSFYTEEEFLSSLPNGINENDDFSKVEYIDSNTKILIVCKKHESYEVTPSQYRRGTRCPKCSYSARSLVELLLFDYIKSIHPNAVSRVRPVPGLVRELDIYIPDLNLGIEYNGNFFHRDPDPEFDRLDGKMASKTSLLDKTRMFKDAGIRIIHIFEDEWLEKPEVVKSRLRSILGKDAVCYARKGVIKEVSEGDCQLFEDENHIQGHAKGSCVRLGLYIEGNLKALMSFSKLRYEAHSKDEYELLRFCSLGTVVGGFSRLLSHFRNKHNPSRVVSYSDKRWSIGHVYSKNGFSLVSTSPPGYFWCKGQKRFSRVRFQRHKLSDVFEQNFPESMTEKEIMYSKNFFKIFDCGQDKWELIYN
jgi:hypothetical protein